MKRLLVSVLLVQSLYCMADIPAEQPNFAEGDEWRYQVTVDNGKDKLINHFALVVERVLDAGISIRSQHTENTNRSGERFFNRDLSTNRDIAGKQVLVEQPFNFPLKTGKQWKVEFAEDNPDPKTKQRKMILNYRVVGWESVTVPAGTYNAVKIVVDGLWSRDLLPDSSIATSTIVSGQQGTSVRMDANRPNSMPGTISGREFHTFWYSPLVKREVKSIREDYRSNGVLHNRETSELESIRLANTPEPSNENKSTGS